LAAERLSTITKAEVERTLKTIIGWRFPHPYAVGDEKALPYITDGDLALRNLAEEACEILQLLSDQYGGHWSDSLADEVDARDEAERAAEVEAKERRRAEIRAAKKKRAVDPTISPYPCNRPSGAIVVVPPTMPPPTLPPFNVRYSPR
jgi:hypothetical protein